MRRFVLVEQDTLERLLQLARYTTVPLDASAAECDPRWMESLRVSGAHLPPTARALAGTPGHRYEQQKKEPPMK